jgi:uncharacterized protein (DUF2141 family)
MFRYSIRLISSAAVSICGLLLVASPTTRLSAQSSPGACTLTVRVIGARNSDGNIRVVLRRDENTVVEAKQAEIDAKTLTAQAVFTNVPEGEYGVAVIHDENKNGKLDMNEMGIPVEGYGHSNNPAKRPGPPNFDETKFKLNNPGTSIEIRLNYWM